MNETEIRNWFGNRGYPFDDNSRLRFKIFNNWIFIHDSKDEYDEVELYYLNSMFCEPQDSWDRKGFSWAKNNLLEIIKEQN